MINRIWHIDPNRPGARLSVPSFAFWASVTSIWMIPFLGWLFLLGTPLDESFVTAFNGAERHRHHLGAALITLVFGAAVLSVFWSAGAGRAPRLFRFVCDVLVLFGLMVAANYLRISHFNPLSYEAFAPWPFWIKGGLAVGVGAAFILLFPLIRKAGYAAVWIAIPFAPLLLVNLVYGMYQLSPTSTALLTNPSLRTFNENVPADTPRVLLIVFDEWDYRMTFEARPEQVELPTFDEIAAQSFVATKAEPPGTYTWVSVPGMFVGQKIGQLGSSRRSDELSVFLKNGGERQLSEIGTIFQDVAARDLNTAILSHWAFPFCDMFHGLTAKCWWRAGWALNEDDTVFTRIPRIFDRVLTSIPLFERIVFGAPREGYLTWQDYIDTVKSLKTDLAETASDPSMSFVFAHVNVPHDPFIYDASTNAFVDGPMERFGYLGNLELTDKLLKETMDRMKSAGLWDTTHVIITSDHPWRKNTYDGIVDHGRVPLLIKLAGQTEQLVHDQDVQLTGIRNLVTDLLDRKVAGPDMISQALVPKTN